MDYDRYNWIRNRPPTAADERVYFKHARSTGHWKASSPCHFQGVVALFQAPQMPGGHVEGLATYQHVSRCGLPWRHGGLNDFDQP
jgi:hypothetical protein